MVDTVRTLSALQTLLADNTSGDISAQDVRDFLVSVQGKTSKTFINANFDFGCVGDGSTNNDTALIALRDAMIADASKHYHVYFEPGTYLYSNNRWLMNVRRYTIDAYGCSFQNTLDDAWGINQKPLNTGNVFDERGDLARTGSNDNFVVGDKFTSTVAGDMSVAMVTSGDSANFAVGDRVLLYGYDTQFSGYAHNPRFFEYKVVASSSAGVVGFEAPVIFDYDTNWSESDVGFGFTGKPLMLNMDRTNWQQTEIAIFRGATFLENSTSSDAHIFGVSAEKFVCEDVTAEVIAPVSCNDVYLNRVKVRQTMEPDKVVRSLLIDNSEIGYNRATVSDVIAESTGIHRLIVRNTKLWGSVNVRPRVLELDHCDFYTAPDTAESFNSYVKNPGSWSIRAMIIGGCTFHNMSDTWTLVQCINTGDAKSLTVDGVSGTDILITDDAAGKTHAGELDIGTVLTLTDNSKRGTITNITHNGTQFVVSGTWPAPVTSEVYKYRLVQEIVDRGGNTVRGTKVPIWRTPSWLSGGRRSIYIRADEMTPATTSGCSALTQIETTVDRPEIRCFLFDPSADEYALGEFKPPEDWDKSNDLTFRVFWGTSAAVTTGVAWGIQGLIVEDGEATNSAFGSATVVTDVGTGAPVHLLITTESATVSFAGGNHSGSSKLHFRIFRDVSDAADDTATDVRFHGVEIYYTVDPNITLSYY